MSQSTILVADDSRTVRTFVTRTLAQAGYSVCTAADGQEAVNLALQSCPKLLVLDIEMPLMDGYTVCQKLHGMGEPWATLPVIFLTSVRSHALDLLGTEMGDYLPKPVCEQQLLDSVTRLVPLENHTKATALVN